MSEHSPSDVAVAESESPPTVVEVDVGESRQA
jgi:hypothetical protein